MRKQLRGMANVMRATTGFLLITLGACERPAVQRIPMRRDVRHDLSLPLRELPPAPALLDDGDERDSSESSRLHHRLFLIRSPEYALDPVRQDFHVAGNALQLATSFEGIGWNFPTRPPANGWRE